MFPFAVVIVPVIMPAAAAAPTETETETVALAVAEDRMYAPPDPAKSCVRVSFAKVAVVLASRPALLVYVEDAERACIVASVVSADTKSASDCFWLPFEYSEPILEAIYENGEYMLLWVAADVL